MAIATRIVSALTVIMAVALMAVSAYAARSQALAETPPDVAAATPTFQPGDESAPWDSGAVPVLDFDAAATATAVAQPEEPEVTPTPSLRYAAPEGAGAVSGGTRFGRGDDLSVGRRSAPVLSIRPVPVSLSALAAGGLDIPPDQLAVMQQVSQFTGLPWQVLAAIAKVESDFGRNMSTSTAGAIGYGQFLPEMWAVYGEGGDPYNYRDAIPAMARYLLDHDVLTDVPGALYAYNHSWAYVALVLSYATAFGYDEHPNTTGMIWPVNGPLSSYFEPSHPAIDIDQTMRTGAPVLAAHDGVVLFAGGDPCCGYGYYTIVVAPSGISTLYAHFSTILIRNGDTVRQGQPLGIVGCTGRCTGTHLHFEVIENGTRRNPLDYLPGR
jgi:murein DD-endopeptidase MepM/ murein hydrolase activator NlpD